MQTCVGWDRGSRWLERNRAPRKKYKTHNHALGESHHSYVREMGGPLVKSDFGRHRMRKES